MAASLSGGHHVRVLINRNFARLWLGNAVSGLGDQVFDTTVILWVAVVLLGDSDFAPGAVAGLLIAVAAATIVVGPIAGVFVDRWDKRRTMMTTDAIRAALVTVLAIYAFMPEGTLSRTTTLVLVYVVIFLAASTAQFFNPARFTLISDIISDDADRAKATGQLQATGAAASIIGPPLAAPLLFTVGYQWALVANAVSFLVSFAAIAAIKTPRVERAAVAAGGGFLREFGAGLRFAVRNRLITTIMITIVVVTLGAGAANTLDVFFVSENLGADREFYGLLGGALGVGTIAGALLAGAVAARLGAARTFYQGLIVAGVFFVAYSQSTTLWLGIAFIALAGVFLGLLNAALSPLIMRAVPRELLGRVTSVVNPLAQVAQMVGSAASGWLAATVLLDMHVTVGPASFGRLDTILGVAGLLVLAGGIYAAVLLRGFDRATAEETSTHNPTPEPASA